MARRGEKKRQEEWAYAGMERRRGRRRLLAAACALFFGPLMLYLLHGLFTPAAGVAGVFQSAEQTAPPTSWNMLLAVQDSNRRPVELMLLRLDAERGRLCVMPIPPQLDTGGGQTLADRYAKGRADEAGPALQTAAHIPVDYRCEMTTQDFTDILGLFGGFSCDVPVAVTAPRPGGSRPLQIGAGSNLIDGAKALAIAAADTGADVPAFSMQAGMIKAFATQKLAGFYLEDDGVFFKKIFNLMTTDYSMNALLTNLKDLKRISAHGDFVTALTPVCDPEDGGAVTFRGSSLEEIRAAFG